MCNHSCLNPRFWTEKGPDLCEFINLQNYNIFNAKFGVRANSTDKNFALSYADYFVIDYIIAFHSRLVNMTHLGAALGTDSLYLGLSCKIRDGFYHMFNNRDIRGSRAKNSWLDNMDFFKEDFRVEHQTIIDSLARGPQFVLISNCDKKKVFNMYLKHIPEGSVLITHNWGNDVLLEDVEKTLVANQFIETFHHVAFVFGSHVRAWWKPVKVEVST